MPLAGCGRSFTRTVSLIAGVAGILGGLGAPSAWGENGTAGVTMPWDRPTAQASQPADDNYESSSEKERPNASPPAPRPPAHPPASRIDVIAPWWTPTAEQEAFAHESNLPVAMRNGQGQRLVLVPPGRFKMGSAGTELGRDHDETPAHTVTVANGFYLAATEVTNAQYQRFLSESRYDGSPDADEFYLIHIRKETQVSASDDYPVVYVSWRNAMVYCAWLTDEESRAGRLPLGWGYRLPTEAEWEYACRAGTNTMYSFGKDAAALNEYAWYRDNADGKPQPVGRKRANPWGFFDLHGNVWEWCLSKRRRYPYAFDDGREELAGDAGRILRGGSWARSARHCRSADRNGIIPTLTIYEYGFRVACAPQTGASREANPRTPTATR